MKLQDLNRILIFLFAIHTLSPLQAQESVFQMSQVMDLPREFNPDESPSCRMEFQEEWIIDPMGSSISKTVDAIQFPCDDQSLEVTLPEGTNRLKNISFEFSFLDLPDQMAKEIQMALIALINKSDPFPGHYDPEEQLLSVIFHEDWNLETDPLHFTKKVRALTPLIWQRRQTTDGEPLLDPDTGYPVFYKLELERINLRQP